MIISLINFNNILNSVYEFTKDSGIMAMGKSFEKLRTLNSIILDFTK